MPYLTPETIPEDLVCRSLSIPNDPAIIGAINGALAELGIEKNWELFGAITPDEIAQTMRYIFAEYAKGDTCLIGMIFPYVREFIPDNCLPCNGFTYQRADWPALWLALPAPLRTSPTTFITPTVQDRVVVATGTTFPLFSSGGAATVSLSAAQNGAHTHSESAVGTTLSAIGEIPALVSTGAGGVTGSSGSGSPHENMPPYVSLPYAIVAR